MPDLADKPASIVDAELTIERNRVRLEWKMTIDNRKFLFPYDVLQVRLYCRPFPDFGEPCLIYPPLNNVEYTQTRGVDGSLGPVGGSAGWEITRQAFRPGAPTKPAGERYSYYPIDLHLNAIRLTTNDGTVAAKVDWPVENDWAVSEFRCWASFGYLIPTPGPKIGPYEQVASTMPKDKVLKTDEAPARSLPEAIQALYDALLSDEGIVALTDAQLQAITQHPAEDQTQYRLGRYAAWCGPLHQLDERFVRLTMYVDQGSKAQQRFSEQKRFTDLRDILAEETARTLVLLGDPGVGKSTLLRRLEMDTALNALRDADIKVLTFHISLSEYGLDVPEAALLPRPIDWLSEKWQHKFLALPPLRDLLHDGRMLLLLDSLNEMPHTDRDDFERKAHLWRAFVYDWVRDLPGNRAIFACRSLDYGAVLSTDHYPIPQVRVEAMTRPEVRDYLDNYAPEHADMIWDTFEREPRLFDVFRIPFMLNMLVERVRLDGRIPEGRAETFNGFVYQLARRELVDRHNPLFERRDTLLTADEIDLLRDEDAPPHTYYLPEDGLLFPSLTKLASEMQERRPGKEQAQVEVLQKDALAWLPTKDRGRDVIKAGCDMNVLDRRDRLHIRYYHQLLQEFFAARKLAREPKPDIVRVEWHVDHVSPTLAETLERIADSDPLPLLPGTGWEETTIMAAAMSADPDAFVRDLMDANLPLAGHCAAVPDVKVSDVLRDEIRWALVACTQVPEADLRARIAAGLALGELGDPRFERGVGPEGDTYMLPRMIPIEGGEYTLGSDDGLYDDETPVHTVPLKPFEMAQFPVTNAEYQLFMDAGGYDDERWWDIDPAKAWRRGEDTVKGEKQDMRDIRTKRMKDLDEYIRRPDVTAADIDWAQELVAMSDEDFEYMLEVSFGRDKRFICPAYWRTPYRDNPQQPVVGVSWYEARAYCNWLSAQIGQTVHLPSEAQWEAAARAKRGQEYDHRDSFQPTAGNTYESHIRTTTPVGIYSTSEPPYKLADMTGNVWEWTSSIYRNYPYHSKDGRESALDATSLRVLRGGSWDDDYRLVRTTYRNRKYPNIREFDYIGFRIACIPSKKRQSY